MDIQSNIETSRQEIVKETIFSEILLMTQRLSIFYGENQNIKGRIGFISAIMRDLNVYNLSVSQKFFGTSVLYNSETFTCSIKIEHRNSDIKFLKEELDARLMEARKQDFKKLEPTIDFDLSNILSQEVEIMQLYEKLVLIFANKEAAISVAGLLALEFEILSAKKIRSCLYHGELYDLTNPLDVWNTVVEINAMYEPKLVAAPSVLIH